MPYELDLFTRLVTGDLSPTTFNLVGIFGQVNQRDLFRMIAANFCTARQERISEKSLADKYYNAEESTRQAVQQLVGKMLDQLSQSTNA